LGCKEIFEDIYRRQVWGGASGGGSMHCQPFIQIVERLILERRPGRVLDIGCGTGLVAAAINFHGASYTGVDVVPEAIAAAKERKPDLDFRVLDALVEPLPGADLVLLKEVTQHLDLVSIAGLLEKLSGYSMILHCSAVYGETNGSIQTGAGGRTVDLLAHPFALVEVTEYATYEIGYWVQRYQCQLWEPALRNCAKHGRI